MKKILIYLLLLTTCMTFESCIMIDRKIKINKDGSGEETMKISFMKEFYSLMSSMTSLMDSTRKDSFLDSLYSDQIFVNKTRESFDSLPGVRIIDIYSEKNSDSTNSFIISYSFDSISILGNSLQKTISDDEPNDTPTLVSLISEGDNLLFSYKYEQRIPDELSESDSVAAQMKSSMAQMFGNGFINFEFEFPYNVISSNATSANGNILTWNFPMSEILMKGDLNLEAVMKNE